ncbi:MULTISPECIES: DUF2846 domain-containing protein [unclassified Duganella]|uniref:DUF2846 domain-containing protein n=1 Tax=unclassified Duganella TaxID=2636909 RepID=UPI0006F7274E|nr:MULTISPECIES: DUF2846 domain-containing protein [unclassified Duganella]KQV56390.1 hypothetical protein ASD07_27135 [Duganella sp. Root336D2]KRB96460.1 hypothetical protein ASE26_25740 [Duganella sp. Root198D2]
MKQIAFVALLASLLAGCAASGPLYNDYRQSVSDVGNSKARLVLYRTGESMIGSARSIRARVDGEVVGYVDHKGFNVFDVEPGAHLLQADLVDSAGACNLNLEAVAGKTYYFEVTPRKSSMVAGMTFGFVGQAVESAGKTCGGAVEVTEKNEGTAKGALVTLGKSKS